MKLVAVAVEEWPKALAKDAAAYEKQYHAPKIGIDDIVILHCKAPIIYPFNAQI